MALLPGCETIFLRHWPICFNKIIGCFAIYYQNFIDKAWILLYVHLMLSTDMANSTVQYTTLPYTAVQSKKQYLLNSTSKQILMALQSSIMKNIIGRHLK